MWQEAGIQALRLIQVEPFGVGRNEKWRQASGDHEAERDLCRNAGLLTLADYAD
jgi:hypothetical protein